MQRISQIAMAKKVKVSLFIGHHWVLFFIDRNTTVHPLGKISSRERPEGIPKRRHLVFLI